MNDLHQTDPAQDMATTPSAPADARLAVPVAREPGELHPLFAELFNAHDLEGLMSLYEADAVFATQPGTTVRGESIREALQTFLALGAPFRVGVRHVTVVDDIALVVADWYLEGVGEKGRPFSGMISDVLQRGMDGNWRLLIDNPFGTA